MRLIQRAPSVNQYTSPFKYQRRIKSKARWIVIIPSKNEAERIVGAISAIDQAARSSASEVHVLVFANNCADGTAEVVRLCASKMDNIFLSVTDCILPEESAHAGGARKAAAQQALMTVGYRRGDYLLSTDADARLRPDALVAMEAAFAQGFHVVLPRLSVCPDPLDPVPTLALERSKRFSDWRNRVRHLVETFRTGESPLPYLHDDYGGAGIATRADVYIKLDGFQAVTSNEDKLFVSTADRQGYRVSRNSTAVIEVSARAHGRASGGMADDLKSSADAVISGTPLLVEHHEETLKRICRAPSHANAFANHVTRWEPAEDAIVALDRVILNFKRRAPMALEVA
jgi:glycosyltransferase involved in cell wall biosynthesis